MAPLQEQKFLAREEVMKIKNAKLEESLISFSKYLQENDAKKTRANKRAADERRICEEKSQEATKLVRKILPEEIESALILACSTSYSIVPVSKPSR